MLKMLLSARMVLLLGIALFVTGCGSSNVLIAPTEGCSTLVPASMKRPVPHAVLEQTEDPALDAQKYGLAETGQLNIANNNLVGGWGIVEGCEKRDAQAQRRVNAPAWMFWVR